MKTINSYSANTLVPLLAVIVASICTAMAQDGTWTSKSPAPTARQQAGAGVINGILYLVGGGCGSVVSTLEAYNPATDTWTTKSPMPTARDSVAVATVNGILYVIGGSDVGFHSTVEAYDPATDSWTTKAPMPTARNAAAAGVVDGIIYVIGGSQGSGGLDTVEAYNPVTDTWTAKSPMPTPRGFLGAGVVNGVVYAVGGGGTTVEAYDPLTDTWTTKAPMTTDRILAGVGVINSRLYVMGCDYCPGGPSATVEAYDASSDTWTPVTSMPTVRRPMIGVVNGVLYAVAGGNTVSCLAVNEAFTPTTGASQQIASLITSVQALNLHEGIANSLVKKLQHAQTALSRTPEDTMAACRHLRAFINEVQAQSGKKITVAQANQLVDAANQARATAGCP